MAVREQRHSNAVEDYLQTAPPASSLPWREASFAVLGLEATGLDRHRAEIVSVACVPVERGRAIIAKASESVVGPGRMQGVLGPILEALSGRVLVGHASARHVDYLSAAFKAEGIRLRGPALDTAVLAAWVPRRVAAEGDQPLAPLGSSSDLSLAAARMGLPVHRPHEASGEALTTAQLFMAQASHLDRIHPQSVGSLARLSREKRGLQPGCFSVRFSSEVHHRSPR